MWNLIFLYLVMILYSYLINLSITNRFLPIHDHCHYTTPKPGLEYFFFFFLILKIWDWRFGRKKRKFQQLQIAVKLHKSQISPRSFQLLPLERCYMMLPCYLNSCNIVRINYWLWRWFCFLEISNLNVQRQSIFLSL